MSCTVVGSLLDLAALGLAPQSMIASLGGFTLLVNILIAKIILQERMTRKQYFTTFVIMIGTTLTVVYSPRKASIENIDQIKNMFESINFIVYMSLVCLFLVSIRLYNYYSKHDNTKKQIRGLLLPVSAGMIAAQNMFFGKSFSTIIVFAIENKTTSVFNDYVIYITIVCLVFSLVTHVKWINNALKQFLYHKYFVT